MYADRTEALERGSYETGWLVPLLPLFVSGGVGYISLTVTASWLLWEVTIFGTFWMFMPNEVEPRLTTKILSVSF